MTEHEVKIKEFIQSGNLESWLHDQPAHLFPSFYPEKGEKPYPEKYNDLKNALIPLHNIVEKGALVAAVTEWKASISKQINKVKRTKGTSSSDFKLLNEAISFDPIIYLNQHGVGHVNKVIEKTYEMLINFTSDTLSPSEVFLLLCSIQVHDTGNVFGRCGHERTIKQATIDKLSAIIPDVPTQNRIYRIAQVHSGNVNGNRDTISSSPLRQDGNLFDKPIREPLLAAILRFADELADDSSRADMEALSLDVTPDASTIYHHYSNSLHTVSIRKNTVNQTLFLSLEYFVSSDLITKRFPKFDGTQLLIDEIFDRTKKVEQERRYCMRFFSQYLPIVEIRIRIEIDPGYDLMNPEVITYTLRENGYPTKDISIDYPENTGEKVIAALMGKGWRLS